ncbi:hypothetical protein [Actinoplanes sp. NPDC049265]|uniref:hypothetical protein n=1 Tax=Actinoplanes sp. NPDC049265 TaxID=3363902 RepID=UPI003714E621
MLSWTDAETRLLCWRRVREFAVPPSMIETATARRESGDWAGACAAAHVDVDLDPRAVARDLRPLLRADLRRLAPDLLRWHLPRVAPDGLLRPGVQAALARYPGGLQLVARTPPAWAEAGQRISLTLSRRSDPRYRLDLHRHLWDAGRAHEFRHRPGLQPRPDQDRWAAEAEIMLRADGRGERYVAVRARRHVVLDLDGRGGPKPRSVPLLPYAATWVPPDVELRRARMIDADRLHPLVAAAFGAPATSPDRTVDGPMLVACRGATHRIGLHAGRPIPLDHDPVELRREELLAALGGPPMPCLRAIDRAIRRPDELPAIRARLDHGDTAGALAAVERLLGPDVLLRDGPLRDELAAAAERRIDHGLFRTGLARHCPPPVKGARPTHTR